jgi:hypothetical protein
MLIKKVLKFSLLWTIFISLSLLNNGCGQIGFPQGGAKDSLPPVLVKATPDNFSKNIAIEKFAFTFNEYIDVEDLQQNLLISPLQNKNPNITANPKTINLKFRDSLLPNTTYTINFGNAIKDINEGNVLKNFTYVFSTGPFVDSLIISGNVQLAETGKIDSTLTVLLYFTDDDSLVTKKKPNYIAKLNGEGNFEFRNLPAKKFKIYALKDGDGSKTYNSETEVFAFADSIVNPLENKLINLSAYAAKNEAPTSASSINTTSTKEKKLSYSNNINGTKDITEPLNITFNNKIIKADIAKIYIADTLFKKDTSIKFYLDTATNSLTSTYKWLAEKSYYLIIEKDAVTDTLGKSNTKTDSIKFDTKKLEDYGKLVLRFSNLELSKKPVLQLINGENIKYTFALTSTEWNNNLIAPGDYDIRILYDKNNDGKWTPGNYFKKIQPEQSITLPQKLTIKANWDNEREIKL